MLTIGPGAVINEEWILWENASSYSVVAMTKEVEVYVMNREDVDYFFVDKMKE